MGIVVPSGYSFNLDGTSIYLTMAAIFIAQALGIELSLKEELTLLAVLLLASKGAAGVTGSGFVTLAATLATIPTIPGGPVSPSSSAWTASCPKPRADQPRRQLRGDHRCRQVGRCA